MNEDDDLLKEFRKLYPGLTEKELRIAKENFDRYIELAWEIFKGYERREQAKTDGPDDRPMIIYETGN